MHEYVKQDKRLILVAFLVNILEILFTSWKQWIKQMILNDIWYWKEEIHQLWESQVVKIQSFLLLSLKWPILALSHLKIHCRTFLKDIDSQWRDAKFCL